MATNDLTVNISLAWWVQPYLDALLVFCILFNCEPNWERLRRVLISGLRISVK